MYRMIALHRKDKLEARREGVRRGLSKCVRCVYAEVELKLTDLCAFAVAA